MRGTAGVCDHPPEGWTEMDSTRIDWPAKIDKLSNPYEYQHSKQELNDERTAQSEREELAPVKIFPLPLQRQTEFDKSTS